MATAISGCVIISDNGRRVECQPVCPQCGKKSGGTWDIEVWSGAISKHSIKCIKCGNKYEFLVKG